MPIRFTDLEMATLNLCKSMGWSLQFFRSLPESEQIDWLAYVHNRRWQLLDMLAAMDELRKEKKSVDGGAFAAVWLKLMET